MKKYLLTFLNASLAVLGFFAIEAVNEFKKRKKKMKLLSIIACLIAMLFLIYAGYTLHNAKPEVKNAIKIFLVFSSLASIISIVFAMMYFFAEEMQYALPLSCFSMAFALPVLVVAEQIKNNSSHKSK